ncbi:MAG: GIY-YIG nuclease family protein [Woeseiaceae bacterium]|nr:GIY-YIG nuclease family protein [Woeseiaceae bacterium]
MSGNWSIYLLRCADGSLYTGIATDVARRFAQHCSGTRGAKYLRGRGPLQLVWAQAVGDRSRASRLEYRIKRLPKVQKENLLATPASRQRVLKMLAASE